MPLSVPSPPMQMSPSICSRCKPIDDLAQSRLVVGIDIIARGADDRAPLGRVELRDRREERIEADMRARAD